MTEPRILERDFPHAAAAAAAAAAFIIARLATALARKDRVGFMIPGGRTPRAVLPCVAAAALDWRRVVITPGDERLVPPTHPDRNEGTGRSLLAGPANAACWIGIGDIRATHERIVERYRMALAGLPRPVAVNFIGMGEDGHVASLFPGRPDGRSEGLCLAVPETPPHRHARITHAMASLLDAEAVALVITGPAKLATYRQALAEYRPDALPVCRILHQTGVPVHVFTSSVPGERDGGLR